MTVRIALVTAGASVAAIAAALYVLTRPCNYKFGGTP